MYVLRLWNYPETGSHAFGQKYLADARAELLTEARAKFDSFIAEIEQIKENAR
jgi:hypothetical protein